MSSILAKNRRGTVMLMPKRKTDPDEPVRIDADPEDALRALLAIEPDDQSGSSRKLPPTSEGNDQAESEG